MVLEIILFIYVLGILFGIKVEVNVFLIMLSYVNVFFGCFLRCLWVFFYWFKYYVGVLIVFRYIRFLFLNIKLW